MMTKKFLIVEDHPLYAEAPRLSTCGGIHTNLTTDTSRHETSAQRIQPHHDADDNWPRLKRLKQKDVVTSFSAQRNRDSAKVTLSIDLWSGAMDGQRRGDLH